MDRGLESLCVRSGRIGNRQLANRVPIPFQTCETKGTILPSAVLQSLARCRVCENKRLGAR